MIVDSEEQVAKLKVIGNIVANCLVYMADRIKEGMSTYELDQIGMQFLQEHGAKSAPQVMYQFPGATCISVNEAAAHGVPGKDIILHNGDMINIDVSAEKNGVFGDTGGTFFVGGNGSAELVKLCDTSYKALQKAMSKAYAGAPVNGIGRAIQKEAQKAGYTVIKNLGSHGIGESLHEEPKFIPGYYDKKDKRLLEKGMVITIEPFVATKTEWVEELEDGWTLVNEDGEFSAQYEHTMIITDDEPIILTIPDSGKPFYREM